MERKNKYLGFRIGYADYMQTLEVAGRAGVSVTDFILSVLLPAINKVEGKQSSLTTSAKTESSTKENVSQISIMKNYDVDSLEMLKQKEKLYQQKLIAI